MGRLKRNAEVVLLAAALLGAAFACPRFALAAEQRVALVIGNSAYPTAPLRNPVNDATAMAEKLRALGFDVILRTNVNFRDMTRAVNQFGEKLSAGSVGLFYYAGHGLQVRGKNFLVPVDAEINSEASVRGESIDVDQVLDQFSSSRLSMVILDACRNNPFERRFRAGQGAGLAQIDAPKGTLIAYSTAPGKTAADGAGSNGVYTEQLLKALDQSGLKVEDVFKQVRINVARATQDQQIPWEASSLTGEFFFRVPIEKPVLSAPAAASAPNVDPATFELAFWDSIKASTNRADFEAYLEKYPKGTFSGIARNRVKALEQETVTASARTASTAQSEKERAELLKALEDERKKRERDASAVKQEMEKLRAELLQIRESSTPSSAASPPTSTTVPKAASSPTQAPAQMALASPSAPAIPPSFASEWAQRTALLSKSSGQLTFSKAVAILLDINAEQELSLLLTHEGEIKRKGWHNSYAMGVDNKGNLIWGGGYRLRSTADARQTALEQCTSGARDSCKVVILDGDFQEKDFIEMTKQLGRQNINAVRQAFLRSLTKNPTEVTVGSAAGASSTGSSNLFAIGFASIRE